MKKSESTFSRSGWRLDIFCLLLSVLLHAGIFSLADYWTNLLPELVIDVEWSNEELTGFGNSASLYEPTPLEDYVEEEEPDEIPAEVEIAEIKPIARPKFEDILPDYEPPQPEPAPVVQAPVATPAQIHPLKEDPDRITAIENDINDLPKLQDLGPGNSKLIVLIRTDRIRNSRLESGVRGLLKAFPDYQVTLGKTDIDPINELDALLIATSNPNLFASTFLGVRHHVNPDKIREYLTQSFPTPLNWSEHEGHPLATPDSSDGKYPAGAGIYRRSIYIPQPNLLFFLQPQFLSVLNGMTTPKKLPQTEAAAQDQTAEEAPVIPQQQTVLEYFADIEKTDTATQPALFLMVRDIQNMSFGRGFPKFPPPVTVQGTLVMAANPHLNLALMFNSEENASEFLKTWPDILQAVSQMGVFGLSGMLAGIDIAQKGNTLYASGDLSGMTISLLLAVAAKALPRV